MQIYNAVVDSKIIRRMAKLGLNHESELTYFNLVRLRASGIPLVACLFKPDADQGVKRDFAMNVLPQLALLEDYFVLSGHLNSNISELFATDN